MATALSARIRKVERTDALRQTGAMGFWLDLRVSVVGLLFALVVNAPISTAGQTRAIPGASTPDFVAAMDLWLGDDERSALPELARLARAGNLAARMLVAMIDKTPALQGPWLALRPKAERSALLRAEGGFSGTSWLRQAGGLELARLWRNILDSHGDFETALAFSALGEARATRSGLIALAARQKTGFADYARDARFPSELRFLIWREWDRAGGHEIAIASALADLAPGDPQRRIMGQLPEAAALETWLTETNLAPSLKALCAARCSASGAVCLRAGYQAIGGYGRMLNIGTPVAALISEDRFAQSPRGQAGVLRAGLLVAFLTESRLKTIAAIDGCFADLLADEGQRF